MTDGDPRAVLAALRLTTLSELARTLGVARQRAAIIARGDDFPAPAGRVGGIPVWLGDEIEAWAATWERRPGRRWPRAPEA